MGVQTADRKAGQGVRAMIDGFTGTGGELNPVFGRKQPDGAPAGRTQSVMERFRGGDTVTSC
jgi:hypothetical protein